MKKKSKFKPKEDPVFETPEPEKIDVSEDTPVVEEIVKEVPEVTGDIRNDRGQFKPGVSGNPDGRPAGSLSITDLIKKKLMEETTLKDGKSKKQFVLLLLERILDKAINPGDQQTIKLIWNYIDGLPKGSFDVTSLGEKLEGVVVLPAKKQD